jgi:hypothetical protein
VAVRVADEFLTFEEAERLLEAAEPEWAPMLATALTTGLRVGERLTHSLVKDVVPASLHPGRVGEGA